MGKGARLKRQRKEQPLYSKETLSELMTKNFQKEIRNSEMWAQMVAQFGEKEAKRILSNCKAEVKSGPGL